MNLPLFTDRRSSGLLNRVRKDIHNLREDIGDLLHHTTSKTVPAGARDLAGQARDLADQAKSQLAAGGAYAASRMRHLRRQAPEINQTPAWVGGAVVVGLLAFGVYALCRNGCQTDADRRDAMIPPDDYPGI